MVVLLVAAKESLLLARSLAHLIVHVDALAIKKHAAPRLSKLVVELLGVIACDEPFAGRSKIKAPGVVKHERHAQRVDLSDEECSEGLLLILIK